MAAILAILRNSPTILIMAGLGGCHERCGSNVALYRQGGAKGKRSNEVVAFPNTRLAEGSYQDLLSRLEA